MDTHDLFWTLATELQAKDPRIVEGTIMSGRCLRVDKEFLALVDYKGSGLVVKLPKARVAEMIGQGKGQSFAPAGKVFKEWLSVPELVTVDASHVDSNVLLDVWLDRRRDRVGCQSSAEGSNHRGTEADSLPGCPLRCTSSSSPPLAG